MAELCKTAFSLLQELKACDAETLPMFNEEVVRRVITECKEHEQCLANLSRFERFERIKNSRWTKGQLCPEFEEKLSPAEVNLYKAYDRCLDKYMRPVTGVGKDLTTDLLPPNNPDLKVRVLQDTAVVDITRGRICLKKGSVHFLPRDEAEPLIRQGVLTTTIIF